MTSPTGATSQAGPSNSNAQSSSYPPRQHPPQTYAVAPIPAWNQQQTQQTHAPRVFAPSRPRADEMNWTVETLAKNAELFRGMVQAVDADRTDPLMLELAMLSKQYEQASTQDVRGIVVALFLLEYGSTTQADMSVLESLRDQTNPPFQRAEAIRNEKRRLEQLMNPPSNTRSFWDEIDRLRNVTSSSLWEWRSILERVERPLMNSVLPAAPIPNTASSATVNDSSRPSSRSSDTSQHSRSQLSYPGLASSNPSLHLQQQGYVQNSSGQTQQRTRPRTDEEQARHDQRKRLKREELSAQQGRVAPPPPPSAVPMRGVFPEISVNYHSNGQAPPSVLIPHPTAPQQPSSAPSVNYHSSGQAPPSVLIPHPTAPQQPSSAPPAPTSSLHLQFQSQFGLQNQLLQQLQEAQQRRNQQQQNPQRESSLSTGAIPAYRPTVLPPATLSPVLTLTLATPAVASVVGRGRSSIGSNDNGSRRVSNDNVIRRDSYRVGGSDTSSPNVGPIGGDWSGMGTGIEVPSATSKIVVAAEAIVPEVLVVRKPAPLLAAPTTGLSAEQENADLLDQLDKELDDLAALYTAAASIPIATPAVTIPPPAASAPAHTPIAAVTPLSPAVDLQSSIAPASPPGELKLIAQPIWFAQLDEATHDRLIDMPLEEVTELCKLSDYRAAYTAIWAPTKPSVVSNSTPTAQHAPSFPPSTDDSDIEIVPSPNRKKKTIVPSPNRKKKTIVPSPNRKKKTIVPSPNKKKETVVQGKQGQVEANGGKTWGKHQTMELGISHVQ